MVSISDVGGRDLREKLLKLVSDACAAGGNLPYRMLYAVLSGEIVERLIAARIGDNVVDGLARSILVAVGQERRTGLRTKNADVVRAVVLLVLTGLLMLLEDTGKIVFRIEHRHNARLCTAVHDLTVCVERSLILLDESSIRTEGIQRLAGLGISLRR